MRFTDEQKEFLIGFIPGHSIHEINHELDSRFGFTLTKSQLGNFKSRHGVIQGTNGGRFEPGHVPANKGKTWDELGIDEAAQERMRQTCYKKGNVPDNAKDKPVGYERVTVNGYTEVKVADKPSRKYGKGDNFKLKHRIIWEQVHGMPIPPNTVIVFADHDKTNFDPDNLVAVPRHLWSIIRHHDLPYFNRESLEQAMLIAQVHSATRKRRLDPRQCGYCGQMFKPRYEKQRTCDTCLKAGSKAPRRSK